MANPNFDYSWTVPISGTESQYPYDQVRQSQSGHFEEWDDTPGVERLRTQHRIGTYQEMLPDGSHVINVVGNNYHIVAGNNNVKITGICNITIEGDSVLDVHGDCYHQYRGNVNEVVEGDYNLLVKGETTISGTKDVNIGAISATGAVYLQAGDALVLNTDLCVHGQVLADSISSTNEVTAGTGIHAGVPGSTNPLAGISTLGGVNVGIPGPTVPGTVTATVLVTAPAVIGSTVVFGGILMDPEGGAPMIRQIYDAHTHGGVQNGGGLTSPPTTLMP